MEIMSTGLPCSTACFTSRNAEYVANDEPKTSNLDAEETNDNLLISLEGQRETNDWSRTDEGMFSPYFAQYIGF